MTESMLVAEIFNFLKFIASSEISILDKFILFVIVLIVLPYLAVLMRKINSFLKAINPEGVKKRKSDDLTKILPTSILRNKYIQSALEKLVYECSGDRAYVIQFHNGGENVKGISFLKFSITNEWCPINVPRDSQHYKDVPLGIFSGLSYLAVKRKKLYFSDVEDLRLSDSGSYAIFKSKDVKSVYISGIFDLQDSLIGLVILEHFEKTELDSDELFIFEKSVGVISGLVLCKDGEDPDSCCIGNTCG